MVEVMSLTELPEISTRIETGVHTRAGDTEVLVSMQARTNFEKIGQLNTQEFSWPMSWMPSRMAGEFTREATDTSGGRKDW